MKNFKQQKGDLGQHWTPDPIVDFMIGLAENTSGLILEPSCGAGNFLSKLPDSAVGVEIDASVIKNKNVVNQNFFEYPVSNKFDCIIGNPPYVAGKLLTEDWFAGYKSKEPRTANAYFHFISKCIEHLNDDGELIFIVPTPFLNWSRGSKLRNRMYEIGTFTHIYKPSVKWENATVETIIFRWVKTRLNNKVKTFSGELNLVNKNGFFILGNDHNSTLEEFFKITVGCCIPKHAIDNTENSELFFIDGFLRHVSLSKKDEWSRFRKTEKCKKLFVAGLTRKKELIWIGDNEYHSNICMIPKINIDLNRFKEYLNKYLLENAENFGLLNDGRFVIGVSQLKNIPINKNTIHEYILRQ